MPMPDTIRVVTSNILAYQLNLSNSRTIFSSPITSSYSCTLSTYHTSFPYTSAITTGSSIHSSSFGDLTLQHNQHTEIRTKTQTSTKLSTVIAAEIGETQQQTWWISKEHPFSPEQLQLQDHQVNEHLCFSFHYQGHDLYIALVNFCLQLK